MRDRPAGLSDQDLRRALAAGWGIRPPRLAYAPVGAGSYHWTAHGPQDEPSDEHWFVTVDDLDGKEWLGRTRSTVFAGLRKTLNTSRALRDQAGLEFYRIRWTLDDLAAFTHQLRGRHQDSEDARDSGRPWVSWRPTPPIRPAASHPAACRSPTRDRTGR